MDGAARCGEVQRDFSWPRVGHRVAGACQESRSCLPDAEYIVTLTLTGEHVCMCA